MGTLTTALKSLDPDCDIEFYSKTPELWMSELHPVHAEVRKFNQDTSEMKIIDYIDTFTTNDVLIIDRKDQYDTSQLERTRKHGLKVVLIDMPWARPEQCDLLVLPNIHISGSTIDQLDKLFGDRLLYGRDYILVRGDVLKEQPISYRRRHQAISFFAGGSDPKNFLELMYNMSSDLTRLLPTVKRIYCIGENADVFKMKPGDPNAMVTGYHHTHLMTCGLSVSLFGVTAYEALYFRTPVITTGHNKANEIGSIYLEKSSEGATKHLDMIDNMMSEDFCDFIYNVWCNYNVRWNMHLASSGLVPEDGAMNVAERIVRLCQDQ
jgi:spore coat polysaccharide biosynthesis predicted glycosyltransferase SpsG